MEITLLNLLILSLACFRLTRLVVYDKITEFIRSPFFDEIEEQNEAGETEIYYIPKKAGLKRFFGELLSCYWCTGIWAAIVIVGFSYFFPSIMSPIILVLAIAGAASIMETFIQHFLDK